MKIFNIIIISSIILGLVYLGYVFNRSKCTNLKYSIIYTLNNNPKITPSQFR